MKTIVTITMYIALFHIVLYCLNILVLDFEGETIYLSDWFRLLTSAFYYVLALIAKRSLE